MESGYNFKDDAGEPVAARHEFDSDIDGKRDPVFDELFDSELELEVDPTQPAVDDELSRFNNALEQALVRSISGLSCSYSHCSSRTICQKWNLASSNSV